MSPVPVETVRRARTYRYRRAQIQTSRCTHIYKVERETETEPVRDANRYEQKHIGDKTETEAYRKTQTEAYRQA